jgi:chromosome partitioning protein
MIVLVGGIKGGTGKSTIATNLAVYRASFGYRTLLVDGDDQNSVSDWAEQRNDYFKESVCDHEVTTVSIKGSYLFSEVSKMAIHYDDIIIDAGGRDTTTQRSALVIANKFVIPFKPRSFDVWTLNSVRKLYKDARIHNAKLKALVVINQADARGGDNEAAKEILQEIVEFKGGLCFIGNRKIFANAAAEGLSVCEKGNDLKAQDEMMTLYRSIYE